MTNAERAAVLKRMVTVLKKNFKVERPDVNRTPIEQLIYSICLENASFSAADDVYNALTHNYFDWNEVRVSSSRELAETMKNLPEPAQTGLRLKRILHYIFDQKYAFEIFLYQMFLQTLLRKELHLPKHYEESFHHTLSKD